MRGKNMLIDINGYHKISSDRSGVAAALHRRRAGPHHNASFRCAAGRKSVADTTVNGWETGNDSGGMIMRGSGAG